MNNAAVGIILNKEKKVLLGKSTSNDFRFGKMCFVGGKIEDRETLNEAVVRECYEESGLVVVPREKPRFYVNERRHVIYIVCDMVSGGIRPNEEFEYMNWYDVNDLPENILPMNKEIISMIKSQF